MNGFGIVHQGPDPLNAKYLAISLNNSLFLQNLRALPGFNPAAIRILRRRQLRFPVENPLPTSYPPFYEIRGSYSDNSTDRYHCPSDETSSSEYGISYDRRAAGKTQHGAVPER